MILAIELDKPGAQVVLDCMKNGFLINCIKQNVLRFLPQYIVEAWLHTLPFPKASYFLGHLSYIYDTALGQNLS